MGIYFKISHIVKGLFSMKLLLSLLLFSLFSFSVSAAELFQVTLLRASPGNLPELIEKAKSYKTKQKGHVSIMRHSQGDHWDLMLLEPATKVPTQAFDFSALADFQHNFLARSETSWSKIKPKAEVSKLFHIEMFHAVHGKAKELLKQRHMENAYLSATRQTANVIFETTFGSDVDSFTIGYHKDLPTFASTPDLPKEIFEKAAIDAGFENRAAISFYLRELILAHHDTLASRGD